ncbi:hypothetical protein G6011_04169 [Alternaria panax]|uniref:Reverse transcriptase n=1 Tax=Alternaria panax TaxID=48097 RepID=A0AAD4IGL6_9PLEO|nr:hypothetical protein G6011_04169 [Alternaria panax]
MKKIGHETAKAVTIERWNSGCASHAVHPPATFKEPWTTDVFATHKDLSRKEETNLVKLKLGCAQVGAYRHLTNPKAVRHPGCRCSAIRQTIFHLYVQCRYLADARSQLVASTGHSDFYRWLTYDAAIATKWATKNLGIVVTDWMLDYLWALDLDAALSQDHPPVCAAAKASTASTQPTQYNHHPRPAPRATLRKLSHDPTSHHIDTLN